MSNAVKWALLAAGAVVLIGLVFALPVVEFANLSEFSNEISVIINYCGDFLRVGRGIINNFLTPFGRIVLTGIMGWLVGKNFLMIGIKITTWAYHFIFKG